MISSVSVFIGGMIGAVLRYEISRFNRNAPLPWGTAIVNVTGGMLLGLMIRFQDSLPLSDWVRLLVTVGFCGGFTTFSTFSYEVFDLIKKRAYFFAFFYGVGSTLLTILGIYLVSLF
ncbi:fluoride efflux transporter CrcB [Halobacillus amylolyticus]|uniref:Fluoride-specific ion channel FluC n=1 Tax=Halobacillus amylolyticus TaxID=2932259 RepID=A0ABY4HA78_9BACI|nr:fluoride efflux transporter CrcB [Halobacillus amylolyticus]UOR11786.1 fluoride efflux transporter CrcB [Halobacillus amylolyticus]